MGKSILVCGMVRVFSCAPPLTMIDKESSKVTQAVICSRFFTHHPTRATVPTSPIAFGVYITARSSSLFSGGQDRDWKPKMERDKLNTLVL